MYIGISKKCPLPNLYSESGWKKTKTLRKTQMVNFWLKLYNMDEYRLTKKVFNEDYKLALEGKRNWNSEIKSILEEIEESDLFYGLGTEQIKKKTISINQKLEEQEREEIMESIKPTVGAGETSKRGGMGKVIEYFT